VASYNVLNLSAQPEDSLQRSLLGRQIVRDLGAPDILALQEIQDARGELDDGVTDASGTLRALAGAIARRAVPNTASSTAPPMAARARAATSGTPFCTTPLASPWYRTGRSPLRCWPRREYVIRGYSVIARPLVGVFESAGRRLTIVNNHLTSRFGSTPSFGAVQPFVRQVRTRAPPDPRPQGVRCPAAGRRSGRPGRRAGRHEHLRVHRRLGRQPSWGPAGAAPVGGLGPGRRAIQLHFEGNSQALDHAFVTESLLPAAG
jgi:hypothetical protein